MVIFIELVQCAKNLGGQSRKNLVEHQIIKMIRKFNSIICPFFASHSQDNPFSLLRGPIPTYYSQSWRYKSLILEKMPNSKLYVIKYFRTNIKSYE